MGNIEEINIKNRTYYFFDDMINITNFDPKSLKIDKKLYKNFNIYYIGYITMKDSDYVKIKSVNPLYLIINEVDGHFEEKNGNRYLILDSTDKNKLKIYLKNSVEKVSNKLCEYGKYFIKIKFNSDDYLPLNKTLKLHNMTIIIKSVFEEDRVFYPQTYLDECLYEL